MFDQGHLRTVELVSEDLSQARFCFAGFGKTCVFVQHRLLIKDLLPQGMHKTERCYSFPGILVFRSRQGFEDSASEHHNFTNEKVKAQRKKSS